MSMKDGDVGNTEITNKSVLLSLEPTKASTGKEDVGAVGFGYCRSYPRYLLVKFKNVPV